jgi:hypothetical protein
MKTKLLLVLLLVTNPSWAEWEKVSENDYGNFYIDPATMLKNGSIVRVWWIQNLIKRNQGGELSVRMRVEYDCKQERFRYLSFSTHSEAMASGKMLMNSEEGNFPWRDTPRGSPSETRLKIVCSR